MKREREEHERKLEEMRRKRDEERRKRREEDERRAFEMRKKREEEVCTDDDDDDALFSVQPLCVSQACSSLAGKRGWRRRDDNARKERENCWRRETRSGGWCSASLPNLQESRMRRPLYPSHLPVSFGWSK